MDNLNPILLDTYLVWGLISGSIVILPIIFFLFCYFVLAEKNIFFTFGKENRLMYIMYGKKFSGKIIFPSHTSTIDDNYNIISKEDARYKKISNKYQRGFFGMQWIGIWPFYQIHYRRQQWQEWTLDGDAQKIILRDEETPYLIAKPFEYAMVLQGAEDSGGIPLNVKFSLTIKPVHATKPVFGNEDAYGQLQRFAIAEALLFVKKKTFETLGGENQNVDKQKLHDEFSEQMCQLNTCIPGRPDNKGTIEILGYEITVAKIVTIDVVGDNKARIIEATTAKYEAEQKKLAKIEEAEGEFQSTLKQAEGKLQTALKEAEGNKAKFKAKADFYKDISEVDGAMKVEEMDAFKGDTLVQGNGVVPTIDINKKSKKEE